MPDMSSKLSNLSNMAKMSTIKQSCNYGLISTPSTSDLSVMFFEAKSSVISGRVTGADSFSTAVFVFLPFALLILFDDQRNFVSVMVVLGGVLGSVSIGTIVACFCSDATHVLE